MVPGLWYTFAMINYSVPLIDNHLHLQDTAFSGQLDQVLEQAGQRGVNFFCCNGTSPSDWSSVREIWNNHSGIIPSFGVHPWKVNDLPDDWFDQLHKLLDEIPAAIGEIGIDRWITPRDEKLQEEIFRKQLRLASERNLPVSVHCLRAWDWLLRILKEEKQPPAILLHAFSGSPELIDTLVEKNCWFSFAGNLHRKEKQKLRECFKKVPLERLLLETDSPDIPPPRGMNINSTIKNHGQLINEPANLSAILTKAADLMTMPAGDFAEALWQNANRFWGELLKSDAK